MRKIVFVLLVFILCGALTACEIMSDNSASEEKQNGNPADKVFSMDDLPTGKLNWADYNFAFPKPPANSFEIDRRYGNPLKCTGINTAERDVYFSQLLSDGWQKISDESPYYYIFLKGNEYLSISLEGADGSEIYVFGYDAGYQGGARNGTVSDIKALENIHSCYNEYRSDPAISVRDTEIKAIREIGIKDLFEKTGMQLFQAFGEHGEISYFLVIKKMACILPCGANVINRFPIFIADIDKDGKCEVVTSHNVGSGISYLGVSVYKYGNPPEFDSLNEVIYLEYSNLWMEGTPCLLVEQSENGEVHLRSYLYDNNQYILNEDYGCLVIDKNKLVPEKNEQLEQNLLDRGN